MTSCFVSSDTSEMTGQKSKARKWPKTYLSYLVL